MLCTSLTSGLEDIAYKYALRPTLLGDYNDGIRLYSNARVLTFHVFLQQSNSWIFECRVTREGKVKLTKFSIGPFMGFKCQLLSIYGIRILYRFHRQIASLRADLDILQ